MSEGMRAVTVDVRLTGVAVARLRLVLGCLLFRLGAIVAGCNVEIDTGSATSA